MKCKSLIAFLLVAAATATAAAQERDGEVSSAVSLPIESVSDAAAMPFTIGAAQPYAAVVGGFSGYDSARQTATIDVAAQVRLWGPISLRGGASYVSSDNTLKPTAGLMLHVLSQEKQGVSGAIGVFYKPEGLTEPEGEIEGIVAVARRFGPATVALDLVYGQDGEGNEADTEARLALIYHARRLFFVGLDTRARVALANPGGKEPDFDLVSGPVATWLVGNFAISAQTGVSVVELGSTKVGAVGMLGLARVF